MPMHHWKMFNRYANVQSQYSVFKSAIGALVAQVVLPTRVDAPGPTHLLF